MFVAVKGMTRARIGEDFAFRPLLPNRLHVAHRDAGVFLAEVHLHRAARLVVGEADDLPAVIANRRGEAAEPRRRDEGDGAAHAETDHRDRPALFFQCVDGGRCIEHQLRPIETRNKLARLGDLGLRVTAFEIGSHSVEHLRRHGSEAGIRKPVAYGADVMIDAEYFLDDDNAPARGPLRIGPIGAELKPVGGSKGNFRSHDILPTPILVGPGGLEPPTRPL